VKYKAEQQELKVNYKQLETLMKLPVPLVVKNVEIDNARLTVDKEKTEKNKRFLNTLKDDIYVDQAVKVTNKMITQSNVAVHGQPQTGNKN
jgi:hypothetical protein